MIIISRHGFNDLITCHLSPWNFNIYRLNVYKYIHNGIIFFWFGCLNSHHSGNEQVADLLLRNGANPNAVERDGSSPLNRAAYKGTYINVNVSIWILVTQIVVNNPTQQ